MDDWANLDFIFKPRSVAVIGASNSPGKWGNLVLKNILAYGFPGEVYAVNPGEDEILGIRGWRDIASLPDGIDLAVIALPASQVLEAVSECGRNGVRGCVVISAGFAELSAQGRVLQEEIRRMGTQFGMRIIGPNCNGIWSHPGRLNLAFDTAPKPGPIAFLSQSGTFGVSMANLASRRGDGVNFFVHLGNQVDVSFADWLDYFRQERSVGAIVCYMEGVGSGRRLFESLCRVTEEKPVIVFKGGTSEAGQRAILSHTGSLSQDERVFDGMCRQAGAIRAEEPFQSFEMAYALVSQPYAGGPNVAIVSGGGGFCVTATDACSRVGLSIPPLDSETRAAIRRFISPVAPDPCNPIDLAGDMRPWVYSKVLESVGSLDYIHGILATTPFWMPIQYRRAKDIKALAEALDALLDALRRLRKPLIFVQSSDITNNPLAALLVEAGVPMYETPHAAVRAMNALVTYGSWAGDKGEQ
ncbi:MAG: acetate--CoA ligase family protein [Thermodesulfobacteriota bacterium]